MEALCHKFGVTREQYEEEIRRMNEMIASYGYATYDELRDAIIRGKVEVDVMVYNRDSGCGVRRSSELSDAEKKRLVIPQLDDEAPDPLE